MKYCPLCGKEYPDGDTCEKDGAVLIKTQPGADLLEGQVLKNSYRIEEAIGQGGMAAVYRGVQITLQRDVAIKVLLPTLYTTPSLVQRFFQEAKLLCQLSHPNVVSIIDFGNTESGLVYMVMELLRGSTLRERVPESGLPAADVLSLMRQICAGVGAAHRNGLVHRDLKPDNIFIAKAEGEPEQVKILDFGIARTTEGEQQTRLTETGLLMGTPGFLAPEQIGGASEADARSDIYALGAVLYQLLSGRRPFDGATPHSILVQQLQEPSPLDMSHQATRGALGAVVSKAMHREPDMRFQSASELLTALEAATQGTAGTGPGGASGQVAGSASSAVHTPHLERTVALGAESTAWPTAMPSDSVGEEAGAPSAKSSGRRRFVVPAMVVAVVAVVATFVLLRPDSSSGPGASSEDEQAEAIRGVSAERILVGMSAAFSGSAKELGRSMSLGIDLCFNEVNAQGGIHGRELELVALDDAYEPSRTVANMAELLFERKTFAVLGNVGTPTAEVAIPLALEQKAPFFGALSGADVLRQQPPDRYVFNFRASYSEETATLVEYFLDQRGLKSSEIAVFAQEDGFGDAGYRGVSSTLEARGYGERVPRLGYRRNRVEVDDAVSTLLREHGEVKGIVLVATYRAAAEFIRKLKDQRSDLLFASLSFVGSRALAEELKELGPGYPEGVIVSQVVPHYESQAAGVLRYRDALAKFSPSEQPGFVSLEGYLACRIFTEGLERAGSSLSEESFVAAVESIRDLDLGIGSEISYSTERHQGSSRVWGTVLDASATYQSLELSP